MSFVSALNRLNAFASKSPVTPSEVACQAVALCKGLEESLAISDDDTG